MAATVAAEEISRLRMSLSRNPKHGLNSNGNKKAFQHGAHRRHADKTGFIMNRFEHVDGGLYKGGLGPEPVSEPRDEEGLIPCMMRSKTSWVMVTWYSL